MDVKKILDIANESYPDGYLKTYYDEEGNYLSNAIGGDTLAEFIVAEITDTYNSDKSDAKQLKRAIEVLDTARNQISRAVSSLKEHRYGKTH